jgi:hypothetical protein
MTDPDPALLSQLDWMKDIRVSSACEVIQDPHQAVFGRADHKPAVHIGITAPQMVDRDHAAVGVQVFWGGLKGRVFRCRLVREQLDWRVAFCRKIGAY